MRKSGEPSSSLRALRSRHIQARVYFLWGCCYGTGEKQIPPFTGDDHQKKTFDLLGGALAAAEFERKRFRVAPIEKDILR